MYSASPISPSRKTATDIRPPLSMFPAMVTRSSRFATVSSGLHGILGDRQHVLGEADVQQLARCVERLVVDR